MRRSTARVFAWAILTGVLALSGCVNGAPSAPPPTPVLWAASVPAGPYSFNFYSHMAGLPHGGVAYATGPREPSPSLIVGVDPDGNTMWTYEVDGTVTSLDTVRDGRLIVGVTPYSAPWNRPFDRAAHDPVPYLIALMADGLADPEFGTDGRAEVALPEGAVTYDVAPYDNNSFPSRGITAVAQSPAGDLIVAGSTFEGELSCWRWGSSVDNYLMRLGSRGSTDVMNGTGQPLLVSVGGFDDCSGVGTSGTKLSVLNDGSVLAATRGEPRLVKALPDGSALDINFGDGGKLHDIGRLGVNCTWNHGPASLLSAEPDGSILVGFSEDPFPYYGPQGPIPPCLNGIAHLTATGSIDDDYAGDGLYDTRSWYEEQSTTVGLPDPFTDRFTVADVGTDEGHGAYVTEVGPGGTPRSTTFLAVGDPVQDFDDDGPFGGAVDGFGNRYLLVKPSPSELSLEIVALGPLT